MSINFDTVKEQFIKLIDEMSKLKPQISDFSGAISSTMKALDSLQYYNIENPSIDDELRRFLDNFLRTYLIGLSVNKALEQATKIDVSYTSPGNNSYVNDTIGFKISENECIVPSHGLIVYKLCDKREPVAEVRSQEVRVFTSREDAFLWKIRTLNSWIHSELLNGENLMYAKRYMEQCEREYDDILNPKPVMKFKMPSRRLSVDSGIGFGTIYGMGAGRMRHRDNINYELIQELPVRNYTAVVGQWVEEEAPMPANED